ncbi:NAD(P)H-binding protein [Vibrio makurazakiensis]|uniref:NAD(P)-dependent oxidoreductase n=1 Tax=Vibrio makurazakiensis TaxID=2910250 RepID=UPI003D14DE7C
MKTLAIIGGTGRVGQQVIKQALALGYQLNVLARNPSKVPEHTHVNVVKGDAKDPQALDELLNGADAVISTLGPAGMNTSFKLAKSTAKDFVSTNSTRSILPLMKKHGISRFVLCTGASLQHPDDNNSLFVRLLLKKLAPKILGDVWLDREQELKLLTNSHVNFTIARAAKLNDEHSKKPLKTSHSTFQGGNVSIHSLATFLVEQVKEDNYFGKAVYVAN